MKSIKNQESKYARSINEANFKPLFVMSQHGVITDVNDATQNATEESRVKIIGTDFLNYFAEPENAAPAHKLLFEKWFIKDFPLINARRK